MASPRRSTGRRACIVSGDALVAGAMFVALVWCVAVAGADARRRMGAALGRAWRA